MRTTLIFLAALVSIAAPADAQLTLSDLRTQNGEINDVWGQKRVQIKVTNNGATTRPAFNMIVSFCNREGFLVDTGYMKVPTLAPGATRTLSDLYLISPRAVFDEVSSVYIAGSEGCGEPTQPAPRATPRTPPPSTQVPPGDAKIVGHKFNHSWYAIDDRCWQGKIPEKDRVFFPSIEAANTAGYRRPGLRC